MLKSQGIEHFVAMNLHIITPNYWHTKYFFMLMTKLSLFHFRHFDGLVSNGVLY